MTVPRLSERRRCAMCEALKAPSEFRFRRTASKELVLNKCCNRCLAKCREREPAYRAAHPRKYTQRSYAVVMEPLEAAWLGGFFDGKGCIFIHRVKPTPQNKKKQDCFSLGLTIGSTDESSIRRIASLVNTGTVSVKHIKNPNHSPQWSWGCGALQAEAVLKAIYPYLFTKKSHADIAFEFMALPKWKCRNDPSVQSKREEYWHKLSKAKGTASWQYQRNNHAPPAQVG